MFPRDPGFADFLRQQDIAQRARELAARRQREAFAASIDFPRAVDAIIADLQWYGATDMTQFEEAMTR